MLFKYRLTYFSKKIINLILSKILLIYIVFMISSSFANENKIFNPINKNTLTLPSNRTQIMSISLLEDINNKIISITAVKNNPLVFIFTPAVSLQSAYVNDASDYLKNIPGFSIIRNGGTNNDPIFRGMSGSKIRILMDNGEMIGACSSRMDPASAYISPETFDILNIIKGPQTVLWGPIASGGILQFQRYHPNFYVSKIKLHNDITFGSNNYINRNIDSIIGDRSGYIRLIGNVAHSENYRDGNKRQVHSAWYKWNADAILSYYLSNNNTHLEINVGQGNSSANYATRSMDGLCFARESYGLKAETTDINDILNKIEFQTWHHRVYHLMVDTIPTVTIKPSFTTTKIKENCCFNHNIHGVDRFLWGMRSVATYQWEHILCYSGMDVQINQHRKNMKDNYNYLIDTFSNNLGIFTECIIDVLSNQKFIGGMRLDYNTTNINNDYLIYHKDRTIYPAGFIRYENKIDPSLLYYFGIGTSQRFPDYLELISTQFNEYIRKTDNIFQLKPEKTIQMDIGAHFQKSKIDGWISSYAGYIKDFIFYKNNDKNQIQNNIINNINNVHAKICGTEMELRYQFNDYWYGKSNLSWAWGVNIDDKCILPTLPPLEGMFTCQLKQKHYNIEASWRLVSSSRYFKKIFPYLYSNTFLSKNYTNTPGFGVFSVYLIWKTPKHYTYSIGINNLFNKNYIEYLNVFNHNRYKNYNKIFIYEPGRIWWIKSGVTL